MANATFLQHLAQVILNDYSDKLSDTIIILPNRRAKVFLIEALKKQSEKTIFAPEIISVPEPVLVRP